MGDVRKLGGPPRLAPTIGAARPKRPRLPPNRTPVEHAGPSEAHGLAGQAGGDEGEGATWSVRADGIDARTLKKLKTGATMPEARLDLHGKTRAQALAALERFVSRARELGQRTLLIIHGQGLHSGTEGPALRDTIRQALSRGLLASSVLAAVPAPARLGGDGATMISLRRG